MHVLFNLVSKVVMLETVKKDLREQSQIGRREAEWQQKQQEINQLYMGWQTFSHLTSQSESKIAHSWLNTSTTVLWRLTVEVMKCVNFQQIWFTFFTQSHHQG